MKYLKCAGIVFGLLAACPVLTVTASADEDSAGWFTDDSGKHFYKNADGSLAVGTVEIDGLPYFFAPNGVQQLGWQTVNDLRYYYDPATGMPVFGWLNWRDENYYISKESGKQTAEMVSDEGTAAFDSYGSAIQGWTQNESKQWNYKNEHGVSLTACQKEIDNVIYEFDENGNLLTGWRTYSGITRYYDEKDASAPTGWLTLDDETQYYVDAEKGLLTGMQTINGDKYCFDDSGKMQIGVQTIDQKKYFFNDGGVMLTGWFTRENLTYHADETGALSSGSTEIDGKSYYFNEDGIMQTGIVKQDTGNFLYGEDGVLCSGGLHSNPEGLFGCDDTGALLYGLQTIDGVSYFFTENGTAGSGWQTIGEKKYYFTETFAAQTGLTEIDKKSYCFDQTGMMLTGVQTVADKKYLFAEDGTMLTGLNVVGETAYLSDNSGVLVNGWYTLENAKYYCTEGIPATGWTTVDNHTYYFYKQSYKLAVSTTIDSFTINEEGIARTDNALQIDSLIANAGSTPKSFFTYFTGRYKYRRNESTRTYDQLTKAGWDTLITYMLKNKRGVCYYLAATFDYMCQRAGYTTRLVHATHDTGNHYWVQVYQNGSWHNYDPTYSSRNDISWSSQIALGNYTVLGYVKLKYDDRGALLNVSYTKYS